MRTLRLGTRGSLLARTQSGHVAAAITQATGVAVELVIITTRGDRVTDRPLAEVGGKGLFTLELEEGLLDGSLDLAVHSMKDMPTDEPDGLVFGAIPVRQDPRDALIGGTLEELAEGGVIGTGSARRAALMTAQVGFCRVGTINTTPAPLSAAARSRASGIMPCSSSATPRTATPACRAARNRPG